MADENNPEEVVTESAAPKSSSGGNPLVTIVLIVNALFMGAIAYLQFTAHQRAANRESIRDVVRADMYVPGGEDGEGAALTGEARGDDGILFPLQGFTANLAQGDGPRRFLRLNAVLKFSNDSSEEEFKARKPQIRDSVISIINSKRPEDLLKKEGKIYLKEEIKSAINSFLVDGKVIDIYYVGFQIN